MTKIWDVIVIGGGASGLMAAGTAAEAGADVLILEKMTRPARKLRITGKGRCNITNNADISDFIEHFGKNGRFLRQAFARYFSEDLISFFNDRGVPTKLERGGRVFPKSDKATEVVDALLQWVRASGADMRTGCSVKKILVSDNRIEGVQLSTGEKVLTKSLIIATGGASYPLTGSTGEGYEIVKAIGHTLIPIRPALIPLETKEKPGKDLADLNLKNIEVNLIINGKKKRTEFGELTFTKSGLAGPTILTLSSMAVDELKKKSTVKISIDLKPALNEEKLDARLDRELDKAGKKKFLNVIKTLLPMKMVPYCLDSLEITEDTPSNQLSVKDRRKLLHWLKNLQFTVTGHRPLKEAIVTAGGISLKEINPKTMESKIVSNLYIVGELLDLHGDTGGFNLQAAFSTGWLAGESIKKYVFENY